MRPIEELRCEVYDTNSKTFSWWRRKAASEALDLYLLLLHGGFLVSKFDYHPYEAEKLAGCPQQHAKQLPTLKAHARQLKRLIKLLKRIGNRPAAAISWPDIDGNREIITLVIDAEVVTAYRRFYKAVVQYLRYLNSKGPEGELAIHLARRVAYAVNPDTWGKTGIETIGDPIIDYNTREYLEAILTAPSQSRD